MKKILGSKLNAISMLHHMGKGHVMEATVKRLIAKASLQRPYSSQIMTPCQFFDWTVEGAL